MPTLPTLRMYYEGPSVRLLQMNLIGLDYNYNGLQATGVFDEATDEVVRDYQAEHRLTVDGIVGPATWGTLLGDVSDIQSRLNAIYFISGTPDGIYGARTMDAVRRFQSVNGLEINGFVDPRTREKIYNPYPTDDFRTRQSSSDISALDPYVATLAQAFLNTCSQNGLDVVIYLTFRSWDDQDALYAQGRTQPGPIVTDARGGGSYHNWGLAFDAAPLQNGVVNWDAIDSFNLMGQYGQQAGLEWGGNWTTFWVALPDLPHFEYNYGLSIDELCEGARPSA